MDFELSKRQQECLRLVAQGITSSKAIAEVTGLSPSSIDNYLSRAAVALGEPDRLSAAKRFVELERLAAQNSVSRSVSRFSRVFRAIFIGKRSFAAGVRCLLRVPPLGGRQHRLNRLEITVSILKVAAVSLPTLIVLILAGAGLLWVFR